ncbi:hypothetical protein K9N50_13185 [bacterium]|nr:hypothetical protein [bacterium]
MRIRTLCFNSKTFGIALLIMIFVFTSQTMAVVPSNITGQWEGNIEFSSVQPKLLINLEPAQDGSLKGDISLPMQDQHNMPLKDICLEGDCVSFCLSTERAEAHFKGAYDAKMNTISGEFIQAGCSYPFQLKMKDEDQSCLEK